MPSLLPGLSLSLMLLFLSGCSQVVSMGDPAWRALQSGGELVLHQVVTIPANRASVFIQQGEVIIGGRNRYQPFCELVVRDLKASVQTIQPDTFSIIHVKGQTLFVQRQQVLQLAALDSFRLAADSSGDGDLPPDVTETFRMKLSAPRQPHVVLLICGGEEDNLVAYAEPPTLAQMRAALGAVATLRLDGS